VTHWCVTVDLPTGSRNISIVFVKDKAEGLKKAVKLPALSETLIKLDASDEDATVLELDELGSFVPKKTNQAWIWIALCRKTRQIVAYAVGDRSEATCRCLWEAIPLPYRAGHCFTNFWIAYQAVIPEGQHTAAGKEMGETAHVERWNNTLRQRLARFVRKTLSFSKDPVMHEACLNLFLHRYNRCRGSPCFPELLPLLSGRRSGMMTYTQGAKRERVSQTQSVFRLMYKS
jgi:insertion element IS1 protein InsB